MSTATEKSGIVCETPDDYHASTQHWSKSMVWDFMERRSVCHQRYVLGTAPEKKVTKAMDIGTLAHAALLEPNRLEEIYALYPANVLAKNGAISTDAAEKFKNEQIAAGRIPLKAKDFETVIRMSESVRQKVGHWLTEATIEHSIYWIDDTSLFCRCRPDAFIVRGDFALVVDIKSTADITPQWFRKRIEDGGYWMQDAHYSEGIRRTFGLRPRFLFVGVESEWPYECVVYEIRESDRSAAVIKRQQVAYQISKCIETSDWSDDWSANINTVSLRQWALE